MRKQITKLALTATIALAITFTFTACDEKKKQDGTTPTPTETEAAAETQKATQEAALPPTQEAAATTFTDPRDNKTYKTVKIGEQVWMAENLNFEAKGSMCNGELERVYDEASEDYIYKPSKGSPDKIQATCQKYGRLYEWETAMKACPSGWHLPSNAEWDKLLHYVDSTTNGTKSPYNESIYESKTAGKYLKAKSGWEDDFRGRLGEAKVNGIDKYGFSALPGGNIGAHQGNYDHVGYNGLWWSSSEGLGLGSAHYYRKMIYYEEGVYSGFEYSCLLSVRCIKD